jgi:hypothetical protein
MIVNRHDNPENRIGGEYEKSMEGAGMFRGGVP